MTHTKKEMKLLVKREYSILRLMAIGGMIVGIASAVLIGKNSQDVRSRADNPIESPVPFVENRPISSPKTALTAPYVRLVAPKERFNFQEKIPVDVYLSAGQEKIVETTVVISYDQEFVTINDQEDINPSDVFKVMSINDAEDGTVSFSLFVSPTVGHQAVSFENEKKIATLVFTPNTLLSADVDIGFIFEKNDTSLTSLISENATPGDVTNVLQSVEGVEIKIGP